MYGMGDGLRAKTAGLLRFARNDEWKTDGLLRCARNDEWMTTGLLRCARNDELIDPFRMTNATLAMTKRLKITGGIHNGN